MTQSRREDSDPAVLVQRGIDLLYSASSYRGERIEAAIRILRSAVRATSRVQPTGERYAALGNLATALQLRKRGSKRRNLLASIRAAKEAAEIAVKLSLPAEASHALTVLAGAMLECSASVSAVDLGGIVASLRQAVQVAPIGTVEHALASVTLSEALVRSDVGDPEENLTEATAILKEVVVDPATPPYVRNQAAANLAIALTQRLTLGREANVNDAIAIVQRTLAAHPSAATRAYEALILGTLNAQVLTPEGRRTARRELRRAYRLFGRVRDPRGRRDAASVLANVCLARRDGNRARSLRCALRWVSAAARTVDRSSEPLTWGRLMVTRGAAAAELAWIMGRSPARARDRLSEAIAMLVRGNSTAFAIEAYMALGLLELRGRRWNAAVVAYQRAVEITQLITAEARTDVGRLNAAIGSSGACAGAAYAFTQLDRPGLALEFLELGRATLAREAEGDRQLEELGLDSAAVLESRRARAELALLLLERRTPSSVTNRPLDKDLDADIAATGARLVAMIGQDKVEELTKARAPALRRGETLVVPIVSDVGGVAIVYDVSSDRIQSLELAGITTATIRQKIIDGPSAWVPEYRRSLRADHWNGSQDWHRTIEATLAWLGTQLMEPIHNLLQRLELVGTRVVLIPSGILSALPLHAAPVGGGRDFIDHYTVTYAPSLSLRQQPTWVASTTPHSLIVGDPSGNLPWGRIEADVVGALLETLPLIGSAASEGSVLAGMKGAHIVHLAAHGRYQWVDVFASEIRLAAAESITLGELLSKVDLDQARLVVLSACESGLTDLESVPDEYLGLPVACLRAGANSAVSTLWSVSDSSTAFLMGRFYAELSVGREPAEALRAAQRWLRDATYRDLTDTAVWRHAVERAKLDRVVDSEVQVFLASADQEPTVRPFQAPFFWAPFTVAGV